MNQTPMGFNKSLCIGVVEYVSPSQITVLLNIDAPDAISLNTGTPQPFPRINSYVLVPCDAGFLVGQIEWLTVERTPYPKRKGIKDFGLVDLPYPSRKMSLNPIGTLFRRKISDDVENYFFSRGSESLPTVGDNVLLPTARQLKSIVESGSNRRVKIGISPLAGNVDVCIDPDRLFGRHLAVLGNTGSGKSCSVAGLIRWSIEAAAVDNKTPNARFIVLDPNGEYSKAFSKDESFLKPRIFRIEPRDEENLLQVPLWFWNSSEWSSFTQASGKTQRPILKRALREIKTGLNKMNEKNIDEKKVKLRRYISSNLISIRNSLASGAIKTDETKFGFRLKAISEDIEMKIDDLPEYKSQLDLIKDSINTALAKTYNRFTSKETGEIVEYFRAFSEIHVNKIINSMSLLLETLGGIIYSDSLSEDIPVVFNGEDLADHLEILSIEENVPQYIEFLIMRIRTMLGDNRMKAIISNEKIKVSLNDWLSDYIGDNQASNGCLAIIDLSLVPSEIIHILISVIARMIFEASQRYRKLHEDHAVLPTVLVMEEAHTFIKKYKEIGEYIDASSICCQVFERIAREGRKYGLGLVLSSQRPSELSTTVLSQCNSFLIHRISNDRDQDIVHRFVPDNLKGLLKELPMLPSQNAILLGWASDLPILVKMSDLPEEQRPQSEDPDFWKVWTGAERTVDWEEIARDWQGNSVETNEK